MSTLSSLWRKLAKSKKYREEFVSAQLKRGIPFQARAILKSREGWTQETLAEKSGLTQGVISRALNPNYGNLTLNTIIRIAAGFDVAFIGRFVPFSELEKWFQNMSEESLQVPTFEEEERKAIVQQAPAVAEEPHQVTASGKVTEINSWMRGEFLSDQAEQAKGQQKRSAQSPFDLGSSNSAEIPGTVIHANQLRPRILAQGAGV
jgi:transcriptional regulator with XRE-family HTH domain